MGLSAEFVRSAQDDAAVSGTVQLVFISPENLLKLCGMFEKDIYQQKMIALVVDEVHYVTLWYVTV